MNTLSKQKRAMRLAMSKPRYMYFKRFTARLTEIDNFLPLLPGYEPTNKINTKELNKILLHTVPNEWERQYYFQGWGFETKTYRETCGIFEQMEIAEQVYEGK